MPRAWSSGASIRAISGGSLSRIAESTAYDPYDAAVGPAIVATFNDYYRRELKVESERDYVLSGDLWGDWDNRHAQPDVPWRRALRQHDGGSRRTR